MNKYFLLFFMLILTSCSSVKTDSDVKVSSIFYPIHPIPSDEKYMSSNKEYVNSFIDLDGNQYVTKWSYLTMIDYNEERFKKTISKCSLFTKNFFPKDLSIVNPVLESNLAFKKVVLCIRNDGYKLLESRAHNPAEVVIALGKHYSSHGVKVGAGGRIRIDSKDFQISNILSTAQNCLSKHKGKYQQGYAGRHIYINMEPVVRDFSLCMEKNGFNVIENKK